MPLAEADLFPSDAAHSGIRRNLSVQMQVYWRLHPELPIETLADMAGVQFSNRDSLAEAHDVILGRIDAGARARA